MAIFKIKLKKGDLVQVIRGRLKGQTGKIIATHPQENKITIDNFNLYKKHVKPNLKQPQGDVIDINKPLDVSKVALVEPTSKKPTRVGYSLKSDGTKVRIYKKSGKAVSKTGK